MLGGVLVYLILGGLPVCGEKTGCHEDPAGGLVGSPAECALLENRRANETAGRYFQNWADKAGFPRLIARAVGRFSSPENLNDRLFSSVARKHHHSLRTPLWLANTPLD